MKKSIEESKKRHPAFRLRKCVECSRVFDMFNEVDAEEWAYGHDCEAGTKSCWSCNEKLDEESGYFLTDGKATCGSCDEPKNSEGE